MIAAVEVPEVILDQIQVQDHLHSALVPQTYSTLCPATVNGRRMNYEL